MQDKDFLERVRRQLERDEGRKRALYWDTRGIPTIGIGRNLLRGLSDDEIDYLFANDLRDHLKELLLALPWAAELNAPRLGALLNMAFNMGVPTLLTFKSMLRAMKEGRWSDAKRHALDSLWATQVKGRANRIADQIEKGEWQ